MTFEEFKKINKKYNFSAMFNDKLKAMSIEKYEKLVKSLWKAFEDIYKDDSNEEDF